jgi:hypothetical protein
MVITQEPPERDALRLWLCWSTSIGSVEIRMTLRASGYPIAKTLPPVKDAVALPFAPDTALFDRYTEM